MIGLIPVFMRRTGAVSSIQRNRLLPALIAALSIGCGDVASDDLSPSGGSEASETETSAQIAAAPTDADVGPSPEAYQPCPAAPEPCKILPLGDSITLGVGFNGGYRVELFRKALAAKQKISFTGSMANGPATVDGVAFPKNHEGRPAWKINQLLPIIPSPALQQKPHIVLLMIGTNDVARPTGAGDLADMPKRLGTLIDKLITNLPDALIVVSSITPMTLGGSNVQTFNKSIPAVVEARAAAGKHVKFVDQYTGFNTAWLGDGVHPNQRGYAQMATVWYDAIGPLLH